MNMSSIPPNSPWRGCASFFPQPLQEHEEAAAQHLTELVYYINCRTAAHPLTDIEYRSSNRERDILRHVFRWDYTPYQEAFVNGFSARRQENTPDDVYLNLEDHVNHGGRPLDSRRPATHVFVSTTLNSGWNPTVNPGTNTEIYRYEIYAPGGIWVNETLGDRYQFPVQNEVCFVAGIAPQYILSAQLFRLTADRRYTRRQRVNNEIVNNTNFNPQSHPQRALAIQRPIHYYMAALDGDGCTVGPTRTRRTRRNLTRISWPPRRVKRDVSTTDIIDWYTDDVGELESFIDGAFRATSDSEAYLFMKDEYVLVNYAPGTTDDKVVNGPLLICDGFPSLAGTAFGEYGIDCAFGCPDIGKDEAFIFSGDLCAQINFAPGTTDDKIIKGPTTIAKMFPFFKGTVFEGGVDSAFESTRSHEAYLFKDDYYALINYGSESRLVTSIQHITQGFAGLKNTIFESGFDAAFASHRSDEAYLFKGDSYALINFAPGTTDDRIIGVVKNIRDHWPSLRDILPRTNRGLDVHDDTKPDPDREPDQVHDEL